MRPGPICGRTDPGLILLGAAPMAVAQANSNADPILAESIAGSPSTRTYPAPGFTLTDQSGRTIMLESLRGKVLLLGFMGSAGPADCPIVQEFGQAQQQGLCQ